MTEEAINEKNTVSRDAAEKYFEDWGLAMDLDFDTSQMDTEDATSFYKIKRRIVNAIMRGSLQFNDDGEAVYTAVNKKSRHKDPVTFHERTGAAIMAMDKGKKNHDVAKTYAVMGDMCKVHPSVFAGMVGIDGKVCEAIFLLLMD